MVTALRSAVMVGRAAELATVRALVNGVLSAKGGVLLVLGEAGIGKSRLLDEAVVRAREVGLVVLSGRAVEGGGTYRAVAEAVVGHLCDDRSVESAELRPYRAALGRLIPGWARDGDDPGPGVDPVLVLGEGLLRLLGRAAGCLLVLEDVHWADADTLALVEYLAGAAGGWPVLVAASARDDEPVPSTISRLARRRDVTTLRLGRLSAVEVAVLAERCAGDVPVPEAVRRFLVDRSEGLPFLVEELLAGVLHAGMTADARVWTRRVPPTLAGLVTGRLAALTPEQRRVVQAAAVWGTDPDWTLLGPVTGLPEPAVLDALRAADGHLLVPADDRLRWRHKLTRDAVLATGLPPERAAVARRMAELLQHRGGPGDDARAAELLAAAGDRAPAAAIFLRLARRDLARGALRSAEDLLDRAAKIGALRQVAAIDRVRLLTLRGDAAAALEVGATVIGEVIGNQHAELCLRLAHAAITARRWADAQAYVERAGRPDDPRSLVLTAHAAFGAGNLAAAASVAATAAGQAERVGHQEALCEALTIIGRCAARGDPAAAGAAFRRAAQVAAEHGLVPLRVTALIGLGLLRPFDYASSPALTEARELAINTGLLAQVVVIDLRLAQYLLAVDGPGAAEDCARRTAEQAGRLQLPGMQAMGELFVAASRAAAGDVEAMEALLEAATARPDISVEVTALASAIRGLPHLLANDLPAASRLVDAGMTALIGQHQAIPVYFWGLWALLRTVVAVRDAEAREILCGSSPVFQASNRGGLHYADAVAVGRAGRSAEAAALLEAGDQALAEPHWWRRLLRLLDLLRRAKAPTRRGSGDTPVPVKLRAFGVTSREMDVLTLVTEGLTNRQIAERLFLSRRTVDAHVAHLLDKTGAAKPCRTTHHRHPKSVTLQPLSHTEFSLFHRMALPPR